MKTTYTRSLTQILVEALYDFVAENNRPVLNIGFIHEMLEFSPNPKIFDPFVLENGILVLNIHVNAAKNIRWDEDGFYCGLSVNGTHADVFAPWGSFCTTMAEFPMVVDISSHGNYVGSITTPLPLSAASVVGKHRTKIDPDGPQITTPGQRPSLKVVK